jgi:hypothetical protein
MRVVAVSVQVLRGEVAVECKRQPELAVDDAEQRLAKSQREQHQQREGRPLTQEMPACGAPAAHQMLP